MNKQRLMWFKYRYLILSIVVGFAIVSCEKTQSYPNPLEAGWKGESVCELLTDNDEMRVLKCTFPPGVGHEKHQHNPHFGYTLKGSRFRLIDLNGVREVDLPDGYYFETDSVTVHEAQNVGRDTAVFLIVEPK